MGRALDYIVGINDRLEKIIKRNGWEDLLDSKGKKKLDKNDPKPKE